MALSDIYFEVRQLVYGQGLGESPSLVVAASDASENISAPTVSFNLQTDDGDKVSSGDKLGVVASDADSAHEILVTSVSGDAVTGIDGNNLTGSPAISDGSLDSALLEVSPLFTSHDIHNSIIAIISRHLWPEIYTVETKTIADPDLTDGQEAVEDDVVEIIGAWQVIGPDNISISHSLRPVVVNTSQKSTGKMANFDWIDGSTGYYTAKTKITASDDDTTPELTRLIATGAAALALGGSLVEATIENTKKDNADAIGQRNQVGGLLWRDFLTMKQEYARELGLENNQRIVVQRG